MPERTILANQNRDRLADQLFGLATVQEELTRLNRTIFALEAREPSEGRDAMLVALKMRRMDLDDKIAAKTPRPAAEDDLPF